MVNKLRQALASMHYEETLKGVWSKAVGYHLFTYVEKTDLFRNYFMGAKGNACVYNGKENALGKAEDPLQALKDIEAFSRIDVAASCNSSFESQRLLMAEFLYKK